MMKILGIDVGGSSVKYGIVSIEEKIILEYFNLIAVESRALEDYQKAINTIMAENHKFDLIGVDFPTLVLNNQVLDKAGKHAALWKWFISEHLVPKNFSGFPINDADAAGIAEVYRPEADYLRKGVTIVLTLGSGVGSSVFVNGEMMYNTELGFIEIMDGPAEKTAAPSMMTRNFITMDEWLIRLQLFLTKLDNMLQPDHFVLGGAISAEFDKFKHQLETKAKIMRAHYINQAGVIGAAMYAAHMSDWEAAGGPTIGMRWAF